MDEDSDRSVFVNRAGRISGQNDSSGLPVQSGAGNRFGIVPESPEPLFFHLVITLF
jgi:hypothetical protein